MYTINEQTVAVLFHVEETARNGSRMSAYVIEDIIEDNLNDFWFRSFQYNLAVLVHLLTLHDKPNYIYCRWMSNQFALVSKHARKYIGNIR